MPRKPSSPTVAASRKYAVLDVEGAKRIASAPLADWGLADRLSFGLPEVDDRYHVWRVPLLPREGGDKAGEIVIDAYTGQVDRRRTSRREVVLRRLAEDEPPAAGDADEAGESPTIQPHLRNAILRGDSTKTLVDVPAGSVGLAFTSPPYFNARPDYSDYVTYEEYLLTIRKVIRQVHRVLSEGRFFVMNTAPVLLRRASRSEASRRIAVPFDLHRIFVEEGFDFVDDIIWEKPEGAGWATGRGRRFAADRNPLQYKAVPVTEYVLVYRKHTDRLIDWNIRAHPDPAAVAASRIGDDYLRTNVWRIPPTSRKEHPAVFPVALAQRVIEYYSFKGDVVLDPFAGIGTTGEAAASLGRRFLLCEIDPQYVDVIRRDAPKWLGDAAPDVTCVNCPPITR
ncbi:MAG: DNA-methyltransferase [Myxococcota bacterium]